MNIQQYEEKISEWDMYPDDIKPTIYLLGDFGELGELIEKIIDHYEKFKKIEKRQMKLALEIGDVYWYIFRFMNALGFSYIEIMKIKVGIKKSKNPLITLLRVVVQVGKISNNFKNDKICAGPGWWLRWWFHRLPCQRIFSKAFPHDHE